MINPDPFFTVDEEFLWLTETLWVNVKKVMQNTSFSGVQMGGLECMVVSEG